MPSKAIQGIIGVTMFLFLSNNISRKAGPSSSLWARAFSTSTGAFQQRSSVGVSSRASRSGEMTSSFLFEDARDPRKCYSTTTGLYSVVEQDLDSALDELLQGTFDEVEELDATEDDSESILSKTETKTAAAIPEPEDVSLILQLVLLYYFKSAVRTHTHRQQRQCRSV